MPTPILLSSLSPARCPQRDQWSRTGAVRLLPRSDELIVSEACPCAICKLGRQIWECVDSVNEIRRLRSLPTVDLADTTLEVVDMPRNLGPCIYIKRRSPTSSARVATCVACGSSLPEMLSGWPSAPPRCRASDVGMQSRSPQYGDALSSSAAQPPAATQGENGRESPSIYEGPGDDGPAPTHRISLPAWRGWEDSVGASYRLRRLMEGNRSDVRLKSRDIQPTIEQDPEEDSMPSNRDQSAEEDWSPDSSVSDESLQSEWVRGTKSSEASDEYRPLCRHPRPRHKISGIRTTTSDLGDDAQRCYSPRRRPDTNVPDAGLDADLEGEDGAPPRPDLMTILLDFEAVYLYLQDKAPPAGAIRSEIVAAGDGESDLKAHLHHFQAVWLHLEARAYHNASAQTVDRERRVLRPRAGRDDSRTAIPGVSFTVAENKTVTVSLKRHAPRRSKRMRQQRPAREPLRWV